MKYSIIVTENKIDLKMEFFINDKSYEYKRHVSLVNVMFIYFQLRNRNLNKLVIEISYLIRCFGYYWLVLPLNHSIKLNVYTDMDKIVLTVKPCSC